MRRRRLTNRRLEVLVNDIAETYKGDSGINFIDAANLPVRGRIIHVLDNLYEILFPGHAGKRTVTKTNIKFIIGDILCQAFADLSEQYRRDIPVGVERNRCAASIGVSILSMRAALTHF